MKKVITQDGIRRVFIYDDGSEESFDKVQNKEKKTKKETVTIDEAIEILDQAE